MSAYESQRALRDEDLALIRRHAGLMRAAGLARMPHGPSRVVRALADAGVFAIGGMLLGSYAFQVIGNLLGVRWPGAAWRTGDVDVAAKLLVAVPALQVDVPKARDSLRMGFVPIPQLDPAQPSTSFRVRGKELRVDLITPGRENGRAPIQIPRLQAAAAPIPHLSLVMDEGQPALAFDGTTATLVVVPSPARCALHKLLVSQTRSLPQQTKSGKDLHQAALLLEVLAEDGPEDLEEAARTFAASGPAVTRKTTRALEAAVRRWPEAGAGAELVRPLLEG